MGAVRAWESSVQLAAESIVGPNAVSRSPAVPAGGPLARRCRHRRTWRRAQPGAIGTILGISAQAAQQRYAALTETA
jgi:hypothetical protein